MWRWCAYRSSQNVLKVLLNDAPWMGTKVSTAASLVRSRKRWCDVVDEEGEGGEVAFLGFGIDV